MKDLPKEFGAYALVIQLDRTLRIPIKRLGYPSLAVGRYLYAGSAKGPGGLQARIDRHLNPDKKVHWHVDHLTASGRVVAYAGIIGGDECALVDKISELSDVGAPIAGFGSSDCRQCDSHLVSLPKGLKIDDVLNLLTPDVIWAIDQ